MKNLNLFITEKLNSKLSWDHIYKVIDCLSKYDKNFFSSKDKMFKELKPGDKVYQILKTDDQINELIIDNINNGSIGKKVTFTTKPVDTLEPCTVWTGDYDNKYIWSWNNDNGNKSFLAFTTIETAEKFKSIISNSSVADINKLIKTLSNDTTKNISHASKTSLDIAENIFTYSEENRYWSEVDYSDRKRSKWIKLIAAAIDKYPKDPEAIWDETKYTVWCDDDTDESMVKDEVIDYISEYIK